MTLRRIAAVSGRVRLDQLLVARSLAPSRERARALVLAGAVRVNGETAHRAAAAVPETAEVTVAEAAAYVSRGGEKLAGALEDFAIDVTGRVALDIGASTGGFTEVLLAHGAKKVYALDVGHAQLAEKLRKDKKVVNMEGVHIKDVTPADFKDKIDIVVIDVSFISLEKVLPKAKTLLKKNGALIALIKPQFEVGKQAAGKGKGIVTDPKLHAAVAGRIETVVAELGFDVLGVSASPILGGDGNREFLIYAKLEAQ